MPVVSESTRPKLTTAVEAAVLMPACIILAMHDGLQGIPRERMHN
jgi:hypothetical protein